MASSIFKFEIQNASVTTGAKNIIYLTNDQTLNKLNLIITLAEDYQDNVLLKQNQPFLSMDFSGLLKPTVISTVQSSTGDWHIQKDDDDNLILIPTKDITFGKHSLSTMSISFTLSGFKGQEQPKQGNLAIAPTVAISGSDEVPTTVPLSLIKAPSHELKNLTEAYFQYRFRGGNEVTITDSGQIHDPIKNSLHLIFTNPQNQQPLVPDDLDWQGDPVFIVSFIDGKNIGALADETQIASIKINIEENYGSFWTCEGKSQGGAWRWELKPIKDTNHQILGTGEHASVTFVINDIVADTSPGTTVMYVQYSNIPGFNDGMFALPIDKVKQEDGILKFYTLTPVKEIGIGKPVLLSWETEGLTYVELSYEEGEEIVTKSSRKGEISLNAESYKVIDSLQQDTTYTLEGYDSAGRKVASQETKIDLPSPTIISFDLQVNDAAADNPSIPVPISLKWQAKNANFCTLQYKKGLNTEPWIDLNQNFKPEDTYVDTVEGFGKYTYQLKAWKQKHLESSNPHQVVFSLELCYEESKLIPVGLTKTPVANEFERFYYNDLVANDQFIFLVNRDSKTISIIDIQSNTVGQTIPPVSGGWERYDDANPVFNVVGSGENFVYVGWRPSNFSSHLYHNEDRFLNSFMKAEDNKYFLTGGYVETSLSLLLHPMDIDSDAGDFCSCAFTKAYNSEIVWTILDKGSFLYGFPTKSISLGYLQVGHGTCNLLVNGQRLYVASDANISVINTECRIETYCDRTEIDHNTLIATVPVGVRPGPLAVDDHYLYVGNTGSSNVSVISTSTNTVVSTISVGDHPRAFAIDGQYLYVANMLSDNISVINIQRLKVVETVPVDSSPYSLAVSGQYLYVANLLSDTLSVISTQSHKVVAAISVPKGPRSLAVIGQNIYVATENNVAVISQPKVQHKINKST